MATKFLVQAVSRQGYDGVWRAGRKWPSNSPVEVEVLDEDDDPPRGLPTDPVRVGKKTWEILMQDSTLSKVPSGDPLAAGLLTKDVVELRAQVARLTAENQKLTYENRKRITKKAG